MRAIGAPLILLTPLLHLPIFAYPRSSTLAPPLLPPLFKLLRFHSSIAKITSMAGTTTAAVSASDGKHVSSDWFSVPELRLRDHRFTVPLDYSLDDSTSPKISVFAREVVAVGKEELHLPFLLYLQGGPAQRGTGLSTPLSPSSMSQFKSAAELADYLKHFRADNIVKDAEFIRKRLVPDSSPWTVLDSDYLSFAPQGLKQVLLTGGIPPIGSGCTADAVYRACFEQVMHQNGKYYRRFPQDVELVHEVVKYLAESEGGGVALPSGGILTPRGLQLLGLSGLGSSTGFERLHYMFERVWDPILVPGAPKRISYFFLDAYERWLAYDTNPLYALMHESIYCQGASSSWSAHRIRAENESQFDAIKAVKEGRPVLFTGEMIFPWLFDEIQALRPFKDAAHLLAEKMDWPPLYDVASLIDNKVPVAAAVYYEDMYVNFKLVMETASQIAGIRLWITNEYMHSGLRDGGGQVLDHLLGMLNGKKPLF
ncbi:UNVERIFIED_CONTAM: Proline iminopeptidase [Sesamum radiatum]|uniref:Proline iminopeptidase n=1 Tax=Sesamum radiatum TaxID=300843 RepID=A0AAW2VKQ9_SESRA